MVLEKLARYMQKNETRPYLCATHRIKSKRIKDLHVRLETVKILEGNIGSKISDIVHSSIFSNICPQARETKEKINKWEYINQKSFCTAKEAINQMKRQSTLREHMCSVFKWWSSSDADMARSMGPKDSIESVPL